MTEPPATLAEALVAFQKDLPQITKTARGNYGAYADLEHVSKKLLPVLARLGLAFTAWPTLDAEGRFVLAYRLLHVSGDHMDGAYLLPNGKPQDIGSAITYARRYSLLAVTGVAPAGDDDDGQAAQDAARRRPRAAPPQRAAGNLPRNADGSLSRSRITDAELDAAGNMTSGHLAEHTALRNGAVTGKPPRPAERLTEPAADDPWADAPQPAIRQPAAAQGARGVIHQHFTRLGFTADERDQRLAAMSAIAGRDIGSTNDLTAAEGKHVMDTLSRCRDRGALIERLAVAQETP